VERSTGKDAMADGADIKSAKKKNNSLSFII
jgi:hypothetical protein